MLVEVEADRILRVTPEQPWRPSALRLDGLTLPGFANAHSHAFHRALRARTQVGTGSFWSWRDQMYSLASVLTPDRYYELARAVYGEMVLAGITCVGEFHYLHHAPGGVPYADANAMSAALVAAAAEAGIRITLLDTCYLHGGVGVAPNDVQRRFSDLSAEKWIRRVEQARSLESPMSRVGAAIHSVRAVDPDSIDLIARWSHSAKLPLHAHVSEQPLENQQCEDAFGCTPTELLARHGALTEQFTAVHATHLQPRDITLYGSNHCTICMCPTTERDLADGIGPARALRDAGAWLSLGSDSHAVIDMLEEARALELDERLASNVRGQHDTVSLLAASTHQGHASLGWDFAGRIEQGALADLVTVRLDTVRTAGAAADHVLNSAVFAATAADVRHVVVSGEVVVADGWHVRLDVGAGLARSIGDVWKDVER
ncbi:MAG: formimidoylglutamate deiminase [Actinomycetota bacterium]